MKKIIILTIGILYTLSVSGQQLSPEVISSAGDYFVGSNVTLSWTIGEAVIETFTDTNCILTQGFQQPFIPPIAGIKKLEDKNLKIKVFPNPASDFLNVRFIATEEIDLIIELIDLNGKVLLNEKVVTDQLIKQINFEYVKPGEYDLQLVVRRQWLLLSRQCMKPHLQRQIFWNGRHSINRPSVIISPVVVS